MIEIDHNEAAHDILLQHFVYRHCLVQYDGAQMNAMDALDDSTRAGGTPADDVDKQMHVTTGNSQITGSCPSVAQEAGCLLSLTYHLTFEPGVGVSQQLTMRVNKKLLPLPRRAQHIRRA